MLNFLLGFTANKAFTISRSEIGFIGEIESAKLPGTENLCCVVSVFVDYC